VENIRALEDAGIRAYMPLADWERFSAQIGETPPGSPYPGWKVQEVIRRAIAEIRKAVTETIELET
jgi:hypothetical protein